MKRFVVTALFVAATLTVTASLPFPKEAAASKMQPGYMAHTNSRGLNANADCRRQRFNICQGCNINVKMRVAVDRQCGFNFQSLGPFAGQEIVAEPEKWHVQPGQRDQGYLSAEFRLHRAGPF